MPSLPLGPPVESISSRKACSTSAPASFALARRSGTQRSAAGHSTASAPELRRPARPAAATTDAMSFRLTVTAVAPGVHRTDCPTTQGVLWWTLYQAAAPNAWQPVTALQAHLPSASLVQPTPCITQDVLWWTLYQAEGALKGSWLRRKALAECIRHVHYEARPPAAARPTGCRGTGRDPRVRVPTPARWYPPVEQASPGKHASHPAPAPNRLEGGLEREQAKLEGGSGGTRHPAAVSPSLHVYRCVILLGIRMRYCPCGCRACCAMGTMRSHCHPHSAGCAQAGFASEQVLYTIRRHVSCGTSATPRPARGGRLAGAPRARTGRRERTGSRAPGSPPRGQGARRLEPQGEGCIYGVGLGYAPSPGRPAQDENTRYVCIGPVNKVINMLCCWFEDPASDAFKRRASRRLRCSPGHACSPSHKRRTWILLTTVLPCA